MQNIFVLGLESHDEDQPPVQLSHLNLNEQELAVISNSTETAICQVLDERQCTDKVNPLWIRRLFSALQREPRLECVMVLYYNPLYK